VAGRKREGAADICQPVTAFTPSQPVSRSQCAAWPLPPRQGGARVGGADRQGRGETNPGHVLPPAAMPAVGQPWPRPASLPPACLPHVLPACQPAAGHPLPPACRHGPACRLPALPAYPRTPCSPWPAVPGLPPAALGSSPPSPPDRGRAAAQHLSGFGVFDFRVPIPGSWAGRARNGFAQIAQRNAVIPRGG
jgi:hypothetical protein